MDDGFDVCGFFGLICKDVFSSSNPSNSTTSLLVYPTHLTDLRSVIFAVRLKFQDMEFSSNFMYLVTSLALIALIDTEASTQITLSAVSFLKYHNAHHRFSRTETVSPFICTEHVVFVGSPHYKVGRQHGTHKVKEEDPKRGESFQTGRKQQFTCLI